MPKNDKSVDKASSVEFIHQLTQNLPQSSQSGKVLRQLAIASVAAKVIKRATKRN
jgi:hypothetical protein